jgi:hypothetical protein
MRSSRADRRPKPLALGLVVLVAIQLVPYGRTHTNPQAVREPMWDSPATRDLVRAACYDCHSNETRWPVYSHIAPISWLVQSDVDTGRRRLNFTEWQLEQRHAKDAAEEVRTGGMPPWSYTLMHAHARLSTADRQRLAAGFEKMFGPAPPRNPPR